MPSCLTLLPMYLKNASRIATMVFRCAKQSVLPAAAPACSLKLCRVSDWQLFESAPCSTPRKIIIKRWCSCENGFIWKQHIERSQCLHSNSTVKFCSCWMHLLELLVFWHTGNLKYTVSEAIHVQGSYTRVLEKWTICWENKVRRVHVKCPESDKDVSLS